MAAREIAGVVWHGDSHHIELIYAEGKSEVLIGTASMAGTLARESGLIEVMTRQGRHCWVQPETA